MKKKYTKILLPITTGLYLLTFGLNAFAAGNHKVTICHATSSETNPYVRIVVDRHAIGGHFYENGTPLAGHEEDILKEGIVDCPTPTLTPSPSPSVRPSTTPSVSPSPSVSLTPSPTPKPSVSPNPTPTPSPAPTTGGNTQEQSQTQTNNQTVNITVGGQVGGVKTPVVQPETGVSTFAFATMFGAAPFGILLRRFSKITKRKENISEFASSLVSGRAEK